MFSMLLEKVNQTQIKDDLRLKCFISGVFRIKNRCNSTT